MMNKYILTYIIIFNLLFPSLLKGNNNSLLSEVSVFRKEGNRKIAYVVNWQLTNKDDKIGSLLFLYEQQKDIISIFSDRKICYLNWGREGDELYYRKEGEIVCYNVNSKKEEAIFIPISKNGLRKEFIGAVKISPHGNFVGFDMRKFPPLVKKITEKEIWIIDLNTKKLKQITRGGIKYWGGWDWISEYEIIFSKPKKEGIFKVNIDTCEEKLITKEFILTNDISVSPDGEKIAFFDGLSNNYYLFSIKENKVIFTGDGNYVTGFKWSYNSETVIYGKYNDKNKRYKICFLKLNPITNTLKEIEVKTYSYEKIFPSFAWLSEDEILFCTYDGKLIKKNILTSESEEVIFFKRICKYSEEVEDVLEYN